MNRLVIVENSDGADSPDGNHLPAKKSIITLGGCNLVEVFNHLTDDVNFKHFWRATIPSIASAPMTLIHDFQSETVSRFLDREVSKLVYSRLEAATDSIIAFEAAGDFLSSVIKINDTIIPDIRNAVFGEEFKNIVFHDTSVLAKAEVISADTEYYWELWKFHFHLLYNRLLKARINRGIDVVFLSRRLCITELKDGEFMPLGDLRLMATRNAILDDIENFISLYEGVRIIKSSLPLHFTSADSPWGGPWEFHPHHAYYADMRSKFLDVFFPGQEKGARYLAKWMADTFKDLSKTNTDLGKAAIKLNEVTAELAVQEKLRDHLQGEVANRSNEVNVLRYQLQEMDKILRQNSCVMQQLQEENIAKQKVIAEWESALRRAEAENTVIHKRLESVEKVLGFLSYRYRSYRMTILNHIVIFFAIRFDMMQIRRFGFNERAYLEKHQDVKEAGMDARKHYLVYGMNEGREFP